MGLRNDATSVGGEAVASSSTAIVTTYRPEHVVSRADRTPVAVRPATTCRVFENEGCEVVTGQASFQSRAIRGRGRGWLCEGIATEG